MRAPLFVLALASIAATVCGAPTPHGGNSRPGRSDPHYDLDGAHHLKPPPVAFRGPANLVDNSVITPEERAAEPDSVDAISVVATKTVPWSANIPIRSHECLADEDVFEMSVLRLVWAEKEQSPFHNGYRWAEGAAVPAPVDTSPCDYVMVKRFEEPTMSNTANQAGIFARRINKKLTGPLIVVFRGSATSATEDALKDWMANFQFLMRDCKLPSGKIGRCHKGFLMGYNNLVQHTSIRREIMDYVKRLNVDTIHFGGSSLGAAMATIAAADIGAALKNIKVTLTTHGSPRVGNEDFVKAVDRRLHKSVRYVAWTPCRKKSEKTDDVITTIPPKALGYRHIKGRRDVQCIVPCHIEIQHNVVRKMYEGLISSVANVFGVDRRKKTSRMKKQLFVSTRCHFSYTDALWHAFQMRRSSIVEGHGPLQHDAMARMYLSNANFVKRMVGDVTAVQSHHALGALAFAYYHHPHPATIP